MNYKQQQPSSELSHIIKSFWMIDSGQDATINRQKIIPDGYPEMIFHSADSYRTTIHGVWQLQDRDLIAGQITNYFYLENTGVTKMFAIKFQPWALTVLFGIDMATITDTVITIDHSLLKVLSPIKQIAIQDDHTFEDKVTDIENWLITYVDTITYTLQKGIRATECMIESQGKLGLTEMRKQVDISERSLERFFKRHIGLSPKRYYRILRFSNVFNLVQEKGFKWSDVVYLGGFYDQSHFIKNFKEFTGEEPSNYGFEEETMANFFLKK
ncbi:helix-turn-helix domain-containing protein [Dokdonia sp.]|uniref:helix-turn-helix domain-containing protein n=1 Tax=Dokdonia sp. TaxID=2024995 RepID=UPI00326703D2